MPLVVLAMGEAGLADARPRGALRIGWTYAGDAVAPGQIPRRALLRASSRSRSSAERTAIYGVVGRPVMHSLVPGDAQRGVSRGVGIDAVYLPLAAADFDDFLQLCRRAGDRGRERHGALQAGRVRARGSNRDAVSRRVQSVNTLSGCDGRWDGAATRTCAGFLAPLKDVPLRKACARRSWAPAAPLARSPWRWRRAGAHGDDCGAPPRARRQSSPHRPAPPPSSGRRPPGSWDVLVNATPVGTAPDIGRVAAARRAVRRAARLRPRLQPDRNAPAARGAGGGLPTIGGLDMLVGAGAAAVRVVDRRARRSAGDA